uniref:plastoquinol--plastocyanin reductase n=1 Tax=Eutreptiella gymnastica TaxID=73025 RepID=A0A7S1ING1_9EUGL
MMSERQHLYEAPVTQRDPALKRILAVGSAVFGLACAGLVGLAVSSVDASNTAAYVATAPATGVAVRSMPAVRPQTQLGAGAHPSSASQFSSGMVPRNVIKPGFKDTGITAVRLSAGRGATAASSDCCPPSMEKRTLLNLILLGSTGVTVGAIGVPALLFFVPPGAGGGGGGLPALDANGNQVKKGEWLSTHQAGDRSLVQGLKGDATYLIVNEEGAIKDFALNAVCTHLGCVVPWNKAENKFMCPCHGSQYNSDGKKVRGPAPLSLALAHVNIADSGAIDFVPWTETDFRTGEAPWWKA